MPFYAQVVVVDAPNVAALEALQETILLGHDPIVFVGKPWEIEALAEDDPRTNGRFDTLAAFDQHPDA